MRRNICAHHGILEELQIAHLEIIIDRPGLNPLLMNLMKIFFAVNCSTSKILDELQSAHLKIIIDEVGLNPLLKNMMEIFCYLYFSCR